MCIYGVAGMQIAYAKRSTHQNEAKMEQKCGIKQKEKNLKNHVKMIQNEETL